MHCTFVCHILGSSVYPAGWPGHCLNKPALFLHHCFLSASHFACLLFQQHRLDRSLHFFTPKVFFLFKFSLLCWLGGGIQGSGFSNDSCRLLWLFFPPLQLHQTLNIMVVSASFACFSSLSNLASVVGIAQAHDVNTWSFPHSLSQLIFSFILVFLFVYPSLCLYENKKSRLFFF